MCLHDDPEQHGWRTHRCFPQPLPTVALKPGPEQQSCAAEELTLNKTPNPWGERGCSAGGCPRALRALVRAGKHWRSIAAGESKVVFDVEVRGHYYAAGLCR